MQKNRNLERNPVNKKAMFLAILLPLVLCFSQLYLYIQHEICKNCNSFEVNHSRLEMYALN